MSRPEPSDTSPTDTEIAAAVVTVLAARAITESAAKELEPGGVWGDPAHRPGVPGWPSELGWWASGLPH